MKQTALLIGLLIITVTVRGQEILSTEKLPEVVIQGNGATNLLLIPCMSCRWNEWEEFMERNAGKYKMFAVTLPGYGGTPAPDLPENMAGSPWRDNVMTGLSALIDEYKLKQVIVVGHSWGTMVAIQLAALRKDVVTKVIALDGSIESTSWTPSSNEEKLEQANAVVRKYGTKLKNAEEWSKFNGAGVGNTYGRTDSVTTEAMLYKIKLIAGFMATDRAAMIQYWRENLLIDLTFYLHQISVPILDIQSFTGKDQKNQKEQHLNVLKLAEAPANVHSLFMYDTKHFIMYHRPLQLDCIIEDFLSDKPLVDFAPAISEYLEDDAMN